MSKSTSNQKSSRQGYNSFKLRGNEDSTFEERIVALRLYGAQAQQDFLIKLGNINKWFEADYDPIYLLSFCMRYFLMHDEGYDEEAETGQLSFPPHYLEILQALALSHARVISARPLWHETERFIADMQQIGELMKTKLFNLPASVVTEQQLHAYKIRMDTMLHSLAVRNWAYPHQMYQVAEDMATAIQQRFIGVYDVNPVALIKLLFKLGDTVEQRINQHLQKLRGAFVEKNHLKLQKAYQQAFQTAAMSDTEMKRFYKTAGKSVINLKALLQAHSDLKLPELFTFTIDDLVRLSDNTIPSHALTQLFDRLSYQFGELRESKQEFVILDNPVHSRPFIKLEDGAYFSAMWTVIPHLSLSILESLVAEDEGITKTYNQYRAKYLEDQIAQLCMRTFPDAQVFTGSMWKGSDGKDYENDVLVIQDSFALIIEAKSGSVTKAAKRGATERLFKTIKELVEEPSEQALRFMEYLKSNKGQHIFNTKSTRKNNVDATDINYFIPLGVTFYNLGLIGTNLKMLVESEITHKKIDELAPSIGLTDLQIVFDVLDTTPQKMHYLHRRREFETQVSYLADELDLLGFYLENGFNLGDWENEPNLMLDISLKSKKLDPYFIKKWVPRLPSVPMPSLNMTDWWRDILTTLEKRKPARWLECAYVLLNLNRSAQEDLEKVFRELVAKIRCGDTELEHNWVTFGTAKEERRFLVIAYPYLDRHRDERDELISKMLGKAVDENLLVKGLAVIGVNIDKSHYPYSVLAGYVAVSLFDGKFGSAVSL